jgi:hypothetical protein
MPETGRWGAQSTERMGGLLGAERGRRGARRAGWGKARKTHLKDRQSGQGAGGEMRWTGLLGNEDPGWRACSRGNATVLYQGCAAAQLPAGNTQVPYQSSYSLASSFCYAPRVVRRSRCLLHRLPEDSAQAVASTCFPPILSHISCRGAVVDH